MVTVAHTSTLRRTVRGWHTLLRMQQEPQSEVDLDVVIRQRIRGLRLARGWSLDNLAARCFLHPLHAQPDRDRPPPHRADQLVPIARALDTTLDDLVATADEEDVLIRPEPQHRPRVTSWLLSRDRAAAGVTVAKMRFSGALSDELGVHPGREWFTVLSGRARLELGGRVVEVGPGQAAEFSTMVPHRISAARGRGTGGAVDLRPRRGTRAPARLRPASAWVSGWVSAWPGQLRRHLEPVAHPVRPHGAAHEFHAFAQTYEAEPRLRRAPPSAHHRPVGRVAHDDAQ